MAHRLAVSRPMEQVQRPELAEEALPDALREELSVQAVASAQPSELPQVEAAEVQPWVPQEAVEAQPSERPAEAAVVLPSVLQAVEAAQPSAVRVAEAVQPWEVPAAAEVPRAEELVAAEVQPLEVRVAAARPWAVQAVAQVRPSEARAELPSAEPSVRSDRRARVRLARRRMTTAFRRAPVLAQTERRRSQSSSAGGVECSSWGLWGEKKVNQLASCRPSQRSEPRSVDSD